MKLFEKASLNKKLLFVDDITGKEYTLNEIPLFNIDNADRRPAFLYLDNSIISISVFWSFMKSNNCIALLPPTLNNSFKQELENLYVPAYIVDSSRTQIEAYKINSLSIFESLQPAIYKINNKIKLLINTSGTTGSPKFVKLSEDNLVANAESIVDYLPINQDDITPLNLPIYYSYGLSVLTSNSIAGGKIVCTNDDVLKKTFWEKFEKFGYTSIAGVPFLYEMLDRIGFTKKTYPSLKYFTQAGGKLQEVLVKKFAEYAIANHISFFVMYGQTEATARMSYLAPELTLEKKGSIGKPIKNGNFIIDEQTRELLYKGPNIFGGYANSPKDLLTYEENNILSTGDLARIDEEGFYYITGRTKRFVKLFGSRINLDEIETLLSKQFNINAKCAGLDDKLLLIFSDEEKNEQESILQFLSAELKIHISVIKIVFVKEIPLTINGKVNYSKLINEYGVK